MKKFLLLALLAITAHIGAKAANGDTTWVQAHSGLWLDRFGAHDTMIKFPDGSTNYRRVYMVWTLGKRACPGYDPYNAGDGPGKTGWCGDWDYTVLNYLMTKTGDTVELGRFITPYARQTSPRTPMTWTQRYVFDVTDYYTLLKDSAKVRIFYSGYSWGFTADVKFAFIEGTPARNITGVKRAWKGSYQFGNPGGQPIDNFITPKTNTVAGNTQFTELKVNVSGHGSDDNGCCEFASKYYDVKLNGAAVTRTNMWRDNCGSNHLYPQSGTWVYDRANWCPGDIVHTLSYKLNGLTPSTNYDVDLDFEPYTGSIARPGASWGSYSVEAAVIDYGAFNRNNDASLEDIIAPSNHETHFRENPCSGKPIIEVMNGGANAITSMKIEYGVDGGAKYTHTWTGNLASMEKTKITLPEIIEIRQATGNNSFAAKILESNGSADEEATNNQLKSYFSAAPKWPMGVRISMKTNNSGTETKWKIVDGLGNIVAQRQGAGANITYTDTVTFGPGSYKFIVEDDGCNGLNWWASSDGAGSILVRALGAVSTYPLVGYFGGDFGCGFTQEFTAYWSTGIENTSVGATGIDIYPNPAANATVVELTGNKVDGNIVLTDMTGRVVVNQKTTSSSNNINTAALSNGVYNVSYQATDGSAKLQTKLVIAK